MRRRHFLHTALALPAAAWAGNAMPVQPAAEEPFIINAGVGGNNTVDLLARIEKDCLSHKPDFTILMIGTNDMNSRKHIPLPEFEQNLRRIIGIITGSGSQVLLMTILPGYEPYLFTRHSKEFYEPEGYQSRLLKVNATIKHVAEELKLHFMDLHHVFDKVGNVGEEAGSLIQNVANSNKNDGIHPTPDGYRTIAVAVYEKLISVNAPYRRLVCFGDSITNGGGGVEGNSYPAQLKKLLGY
ncbi:GDSL-type esterase/lipase family protein [Dyadobacter sp. CY343]|uniref:SGNH/GDSL hydrolase family protein n=1 Tax=Dyadobacter sp. CY343 TaxID=2907299 RepID=UPI001F275A6E|nr:GDSL-type esterase/lipase family protein [Dyadobacter sp. CY343]MCE7060289.1 GDSL-type esterase/lipase family protein [Dyadobacter sp. CY343]